MNNSLQIQRHAIAKSNKPLNKYNTSLHQDTESLTGEPNDRTAEDIGVERELPTNE